MPGCCVSLCTNRTEKGFKLYKIPDDKNGVKRQLWLELIGRSEVAPNCKVCEIHFSSNQFEGKRKDNRKLLRSDAVPDLITPGEIAAYFDVTEETALPNANNLGEMTYNKRMRLDTSHENDHDYSLLDEEYEIRAQSNEDIAYDENMDHLLCDEDVESTEDLAIKIVKLKTTLRQAWQKCYSYKKQLGRKTENLDKIFNDDQLKYLTLGSHRGVKWSHDTMIKALKLYMACGEKVYEELCKQNLPYPSIRTIQHRLRNLKFQPGFLHDVFNLLQMDNFRPEEKHATLLIDEMAIKPGLQYDNSLASIIGRTTMSSSSGQSEELATHALAFMLAGVSSRWKQTVAYELTGKSFSAQGILTIIVDIIKRAHEIGVTVRAIIHGSTKSKLLAIA